MLMEALVRIILRGMKSVRQLSLPWNSWQVIIVLLAMASSTLARGIGISIIRLVTK